jgi:subtilisin family serine protease
MSDLKPYYVTVDHPTLKDEVLTELKSTSGDEPIPNRPVDVPDDHPGSEYTVEALLTEQEALDLLHDLRVRSVELDPEIYLNVRKGTHGARTGTYSNAASVSATDKNYGLIRSTTSTNDFSVSYSSTKPFNFNLDGSGVDIVVFDTGVEPYHPEFAVNADGTGGTRVIDHDWTQYGFITSVPTGGFLGDCDGHGSNCASIAAGNTNGWAPKAKIYSIRTVPGGAGSPYTSIADGRTLSLVNEIKGWQSVRAWHNAKPIDPTTGYKRPTVITGSYGYNESYSNGLNSVTYRGTTRSLTTTTGDGATLYGTIGAPELGEGTFGYRYTAVESEIQSCINAGIIIICAAGNDSHKIDVLGGLDYNNYVQMNDFPSLQRPYHRGGTPGSAVGVICVGALDNYYTSYDNKAYFSCTGPRIDLYAPGVKIMGAYASGVADPRTGATTSTSEQYYLSKISGTSQATPQVTGVVACLLQARPWMTATSVANWLKSVSTKDALNETAYSTYAQIPHTGTYTNLASIQGGNNYILYQAFNLPDPLTIRG